MDGTAREIELNAVYAEEFRTARQPFIDAARKAGNGGVARRAGAARAAARPSGPNPSVVRAWAKDQGIEVKDKGRVPAELVVRFQDASRSVTP